MYQLATEALSHKVQAAVLKAKMLKSGDVSFKHEFLHQMEQSVQGL